MKSKNLFKSPFLLAGMVALFCISLFLGCVRPADAQDLYQTKRLKRSDTLFVVNVAGNERIQISFGDSSNSVTDTINVYLVTAWGEEVLARLSPLNDTGAVYAAEQKLGQVIPGDGSTVFFQVVWDRPYEIKLVRTNAYSQAGVTRVSVSAYKVTGDLFEPNKVYRNNLAWQDTYEHIDYRNPGFY